MTITSDSVVTLHYTVSTEDGTTLDSSVATSSTTRPSLLN